MYSIQSLLFSDSDNSLARRSICWSCTYNCSECPHDRPWLSSAPLLQAMDRQAISSRGWTSSNWNCAASHFRGNGIKCIRYLIFISLFNSLVGNNFSIDSCWICRIIGLQQHHRSARTNYNALEWQKFYYCPVPLSIILNHGPGNYWLWRQTGRKESPPSKAMPIGWLLSIQNRFKMAMNNDCKSQIYRPEMVKW